jgi:hypothetical protein
LPYLSHHPYSSTHFCCSLRIPNIVAGTAAVTRSHETALRRSDSPLEPDFERIANDGVNELRNSFDSAFHELPTDSQELDDDDVDMEGDDEPEVSSIPGDGM